MSRNEYRGGGRGRGGYGHGRGGRGGVTSGGVEHTARNETNDSCNPGSHQELDQFLRQIDRKNYGAYKDLKNSYQWNTGLPIHLFVDHVQSDPYAAASRFRARLPIDKTGFPPEIYNSHIRVVALCDYLNRHIASLVHQWRLDVADVSGNYNGPKGGNFNIYQPSQQVLERSSCVIVDIGEQDPAIEIRFTVILPANGRMINGIKARDLLIEQLPKIMEKGILWRNQDQLKLKTHVRSVEVQEGLRNKLLGMDLLAFVGNGAILPRASGADPRPMDVGAVEFQSPPSLQVTIDSGVVDEAGRPIAITGMGIPRGIAVITGGGFHGKSTLLEALQFGIYNVIPGDGRQLVVTEPGAFKIRAEDGRNVESVDITPFISQLPGGKSTSSFSTPDASGSTSMAVNIQEALEIGATSLIIDEDTSATNFLVRDSKMHELVRSEPITPLVSKMQALFSEKGVSIIIVVGGCGDYLNVAHTVIGMESYLPHDWTTRAHQISSKYPNAAPTVSSYGNIPSRILTLLELGSKPPVAYGLDKISFRYDRFKVETGDNLPEVDLAFLEQFVEPGQANTCVEALQHIGALSGASGASKLTRDWVKELQVLSGRNGVNLRGDIRPFGNLAFARPLEILSVVNRVRALKVSVTIPPIQLFHTIRRVMNLRR